MDIIKISAIVGAFTVLSGGLWAAADYTETRPILKREFAEFQEKDFKLLQQQSVDVTQAVLSIRFWLLMDKMKANGELTLDDQRDLCKLAKELQYVGIAGCPNY